MLPTQITQPALSDATPRTSLSVLTLESVRHVFLGRHPDWSLESDPVLSPDGSWVVFQSAGTTTPGLYRLATSGGRPTLLANEVASFPRSWSFDGRYVTYDKGGDVWLVVYAQDFPSVLNWPALLKGR